MSTTEAVLPRESLEASHDLVCTVIQDAINAKALPPKRVSFAVDLLAAYKKYGSWTPKQDWWARFIYAESLGILEKPAPPSAEVGDLHGLYALFAEAKKHVKYPSITLQTKKGHTLKMNISGARSKTPNVVQLTDGRPFGNNTWYGRVDEGGHWRQNSNVEAEVLEDVGYTLKSLATDPVATAKEYALLTGSCCFCNKPLTDVRSTAAGFGPVCAKYYGLYDKWKEQTAVFDSVSIDTAAGTLG